MLVYVSGVGTNGGRGGSRTFVHQFEDDVLVVLVVSSEFAPEVDEVIICHILGSIRKVCGGLADDGAIVSRVVVLELLAVWKSERWVDTRYPE